MKAVLNLQDGANACILPLLQIDRDSGNPQPLVNAQCTDEYYRGHSALHIAIEKRSLQCVKLLVENGADVHARACGHFFQKKSQGTCFYFGEEPFLDKLRCGGDKAVPKVTWLMCGRAGPLNPDLFDPKGLMLLITGLPAKAVCLRRCFSLVWARKLPTHPHPDRGRGRG